MTGLAPYTLYYVKAYATNSVGTAYGDQVSFSTIAFAVGQAYGGGIIFYLDGTGQHGLISATSDQSAAIIWAVPAFQSASVPGGTSTAIGSGSTNTDKIIAQNGAGITYAAGLARSYTGGSYSDWFLPSKDELNLMYAQKTAIGGLASNTYWSSSEYDSNEAWYEIFGNGGQYYYLKDLTIYVRAVRAF